MSIAFFRSFVLLIFSTSLLYSCVPLDQPNINSDTNLQLIENNTIPQVDSLPYQDTVYVPIYSDIYNESKDVKFNLTATLSIRNTSLKEKIYIHDIDYYDSKGKLVRKYISNEQDIYLDAMQSIEYVIEENDTEGGTGANFIINWASTNPNLYPIFEGIMISTNGQQGISFSTMGISIKENR